MSVSFSSIAVRRARIAATVFAAAVAIAATRPAAAAFHVHLERTDPADSAHVATAPKAIRLWFSGKVEMAVTGVTLTGPGGATIAVSDAKMANSSDTAAVVVDIKGAMPAGHYDVAWHTAAADMHPTRGKFSFTVDGTAPAQRKP